MQRVEQWMTREPRTCRPEDSLADAARAMWEQDCGVVPVVNAERELVGVVTDRDVCMAAWSRGLALHEISVRSTMQTRLFSCLASDALVDATEEMQRAEVRRLPVVDSNGLLVGILSLQDLARAWAEHPVDGLSADELVETLAAVSAPRAKQVALEPARPPVVAASEPVAVRTRVEAPDRAGVAS